MRSDDGSEKYYSAAGYSSGSASESEFSLGSASDHPVDMTGKGKGKNRYARYIADKVNKSQIKKGTASETSSEARSSLAGESSSSDSEVEMQKGSLQFDGQADNMARKHANGECQPCLYYIRKTGCLSGQSCMFCHLPHEKNRAGKAGAGYKGKGKRQAGVEAPSERKADAGYTGQAAAEAPTSLTANPKAKSKAVPKPKVSPFARLQNKRGFAGEREHLGSEPNSAQEAKPEAEHVPEEAKPSSSSATRSSAEAEVEEVNNNMSRMSIR